MRGRGGPAGGVAPADPPVPRTAPGPRRKDRKGVEMASAPFLRIEDLHVSVEGKPVLQGVDLEVPKGEVHALMGRNGTGAWKAPSG